MEGGTLFTPGFLGAHFNWWVGQIADDSTWRDNTLPGKHSSGEEIPGYGRRYKVRIIGYHDQQEETIPSDQLPWANVMYPITAGGGQAAASQTPNLRQGMFVFGFFLDGQDQQVPVIMGVLGNNAQTSLKTKIGQTDTNFGPTSGYAEPANGNKDQNIKAPDADLVVNKPKSSAQKEECAPPPKGVKLNKYGLRPDKSLSSQQLADAQNARAEADTRGLTGQAREDFVQKAVADNISARCSNASSPTSPSQPGATKENADAVHQTTSADVKKHDRAIRKIPLGDPHNPVTSSLKSIQVILDNLTKDINKILQTALSYIDAVSNVLDDIDGLITAAACRIARHIKVVFDKVFEYILKTVQKAIAPTVNTLFPNQRHMLADLKEQITALLTCLFEKLIAKLCDQIAGLLKQGLQSLLDKLDTETPTPDDSAPKVPICYVENLTGTLLASNKNEITENVDTIIQKVDSFLNEMKSIIDSIKKGVTDASGIASSIDGISGNISDALNFENIKLSVFGCDLKPNLALSNFYTFQAGSGSQEETEKPRLNDISDATKNQPQIPEVAAKPFAKPERDLADYNYKADASSQEQIQSRNSSIA
jgi:hypothetical protein